MHLFTRIFTGSISMHTPSQRETHTHTYTYTYTYTYTHTRILKRHGYSRDINIEVGAVASGPRLAQGVQWELEVQRCGALEKHEETHARTHILYKYSTFPLPSLKY